MQVKQPTKTVYYGPLSKICALYVEEKKTLGYDYTASAKRLSDFSKFTMAFDFEIDTLPEDIVLSYVASHANEAYRNREARCTVVRGLAEYMIRNGYSAYLLPADYLGKRAQKYIPYIFSHDEIMAFFFCD